jgi:hypothetical protein
MSGRLHDVLEDIAGDLAPVDLTAAVSARAKRLRWARRAAAGSTALGVAATVGLVSLVLPSGQAPSGPDVIPPMTTPTIAPLADGVDLDAAAFGTVESASAVVVVNGDDGLLAVAADLATGAATALPVDVPADANDVQLSADGTRALVVGQTQAVVVDLPSGETMTYDRAVDQPYALAPDGASIFTVVQVAEETGVADPAQWQLMQVDAMSGDETPTPYLVSRNKAAAQVWPAPDGETVFLRYEGALRDPRTHRIDLASGAVTFSEPYTSLSIQDLRWSSDGSVLAAEMASSLRVLEPTDEIGRLLETVGKVGTPMGFVGSDRLAWKVPIPDGAELVITDLTGLTVGTPTRLLTSGTVVAMATAL